MQLVQLFSHSDAEHYMTLLNDVHSCTFVVTCVYRDHKRESWHGYCSLCLFKEVLPRISVLYRWCHTTTKHWWLDKRHTTGWPGTFLANNTMHTNAIEFQNSDKDKYVEDAEFRQTHTLACKSICVKNERLSKGPQTYNLWMYVIWPPANMFRPIDCMSLPSKLTFTIYKLQTSC